MDKRLIITLTMILTRFHTLVSTECVFEDYMTCNKIKDCCRIQLNNDFMCVSKEHLWNNFQERFEERYKDSDKQLKDENLNFNYKDGQNMCVKWKEINSQFFTEFNISYNCECMFGWIVGVGVVGWGLGLVTAF